MHDNHHHRHHPKIHVMEKKEFSLPPFFSLLKTFPIPKEKVENV